MDSKKSFLLSSPNCRAGLPSILGKPNRFVICQVQALQQTLFLSPGKEHALVCRSPADVTCTDVVGFDAHRAAVVAP